MLAVAATGCLLPARLRPLPAASADGLLRGLAERRTELRSLRARARVREGINSLWTREIVLVRRPDDVRVDVLSPFGLAIAIGTDGDRLWAFPPADGVRYEGPASPENLSRILGAPIALGDLVDVLTGLPPQRTPAGPLQLDATPEREYRLLLPLADGVQRLWFAGDPLQLVRAEESRTGTPVLRVAFGDHDAGLPHTIEVTAPASGATLTLRYEQVEQNPALDPALFAPPDAPAVRPLPATPTKG